ncbi:MAG: hypothetical protein C0518_08350 [Opitutus sp.]|nr:hypothetical protein [Opitutus sp.]
MRNVRSRLILVAVGLGVLGTIGGGWQFGRTASPTKLAAVATLPVSADRVVRFEIPGAEEANEVVERFDEGAPRSALVAELSANDAAQFAALCQLRLLAADTELDLSHREWATLAAAVAHAQAVRLNYEAEIAHVVAVAPGRHRVEVPAYAEAGEELRRQFTAELHAGLGEAVAGEVLAKLGRQLEGSFAGFGVSNQTLEVAGDPARAPGDVTIERTARYGNSADDDGRVLTRREMLFPLAEDPTGESWTVLLARVGKAD